MLTVAAASLLVGVAAILLPSSVVVLALGGLVTAGLILAWTPATGALAAVGCALIFWTVLCHLATTPKGTLS